MTTTATRQGLNVLLVDPAPRDVADDVTATINLDPALVGDRGPVGATGIDSAAWSAEFVELGGTAATVDYRSLTLRVDGTAASIVYALASASTKANDPTPPHKRPTSCHVCGRPPLKGQQRPACGHDYTNAEARAEAAAYDARVVTYDPAAKYVDDTRGR